MVMVAKGEAMFAGNNEDWQDPDTRMWFVPAADGEYGRVCFGFGENGFTQGGMNDQGLFIDGNALSPTGWQADPDKETYNKNLMDHILARCATVNEAAEFFKLYNFTSLAVAKFPMADARGGSAVVEWGQGKLQVIKREGRYQISTNFVQSNFKREDYPCPRYEMADQILGSRDAADIDIVRQVLSATHSEYFYPTVYSNIYDLEKRLVYLYNFHNFEDVVVIDLVKELEKGARSIAIPSLFSLKTQAARLYERYRTKPGSVELYNVFKAGGLSLAIKKYDEWKTEFRKLYAVDVSEREINNLGYILLRAGEHEAAIQFFKLNTDQYPQSANTYDSLAEAYMVNGDKAMAMLNYKKSLELNPGNQNAVEKMKEMAKEK